MIGALRAMRDADVVSGRPRRPDGPSRPPGVRMGTVSTLVGAVLWAVLWAVPASGDDWPTYLHDPARSGVTTEALSLPLRPVWTHRSPHAPRPAWPPPAKQDFWHDHPKLEPSVTFDRAFHVAVAGGSVLYGSSADDKVWCLDASTGAVRWTCFTEGPVRLAPTVSEGRVYVGSDDGCVYCLAASDGAMLWKRRLAPADRRVPGNGRMISAWPVRTGVLVADGTAYACAGLFPAEGVEIHALRADDGSPVWSRGSGDISPQGYLLASSGHLFVPSGRTAPVQVRRSDGGGEALVSGSGGSFALLTAGAIATGPGRVRGEVAVSDAETRERIASFQGIRMVAHAGRAWIVSTDSLSALDHERYLALGRERLGLERDRGALERKLREAGTAGAPEEPRRRLAAEIAALREKVAERNRAMEACALWRVRSERRFALILCGDLLVTGGDGDVAALRAADGTEVWSAPVEGKAWGLAAAGGRLFASTDSGSIHCFAAEGSTP